MIGLAGFRAAPRRPAASTRWMVALVLSFAWGLAAHPAAAQLYRGSAGWAVGGLYSTSLNNGSDASVALEPDVAPVVSVSGERWFDGGVAGLRFQLATTKQGIEWRQGTRDIAMYEGDVSLLIRFGRPSAERTVMPWVGIGAGGVWRLLGNGIATSFPEAGVRYSGDESFSPVGVASLGVDVVTRFKWGEGPVFVRIEASDAAQLDSPFDPIDAEASDFGVVHNVRLSLGIHTGMGVLR